MRDNSVKAKGRPGEISLKGMGYGLKMLLPDSLPEDELMEKLKHVLPRTSQLPMGEGIVMDLGLRDCPEELILKLLSRVVWPGKLRVLAWLSSHEGTLRRLRDAGLSTKEPAPPAPPVFAPRPHALILYQSLRSGQRADSDGDVVLWGHLNAGAEISAAGSVIVLGRLKGLVHAGRDEREDAYVFAGSFEPQQLRVGSKLSFSDASREWWQKPVLITLQDGKLIVRETASLMGLS
ncbi:MAG: septum site-determining protein MinC [Fretibacterium sp.]|nr:septum site-determining protein MinC [Fretibacterium sp.]